eukprot:3409482-Prymnesium_polylepis.1
MHMPRHARSSFRRRSVRLLLSEIKPRSTSSLRSKPIIFVGRGRSLGRSLLARTSTKRAAVHPYGKPVGKYTLTSEDGTRAIGIAGA